MKRCEGCGSYYSDFDKVCPHCGLADEKIVVAESGQETEAVNTEAAPDQWRSETSEKDRADYPQYGDADPSVRKTAEISGYSLKWHRFLMVTMIIGGVLSIFSGLSLALTQASVYGDYDFLKPYDSAYGIASIAIGTYQLIVRNRLKAFRMDGPKMLMILYAVSLLANIVYAVSMKAALASIGSSYNPLDTEFFAQIITMIIFAGINYVYYNKRKELFVN